MSNRDWSQRPWLSALISAAIRRSSAACSVEVMQGEWCKGGATGAQYTAGQEAGTRPCAAGRLADCYRQSLRHRPDHPATQTQLGQALQQCGRLEAAVQA
jgi:hypothetical protein